MPYYHTCPYCGSNLDPCEKCDCEIEENNNFKEETNNVRNQHHSNTS